MARRMLSWRYSRAWVRNKQGLNGNLPEEQHLSFGVATTGLCEVKEWYVQESGCFLLLSTNKKISVCFFVNHHLLLFSTSCGSISHSIVQSSSSVFWEVTLTSGLHVPTSILVLLCVSCCLKPKIYAICWWCLCEETRDSGCDSFEPYKGPRYT